MLTVLHNGMAMLTHSISTYKLMLTMTTVLTLLHYGMPAMLIQYLTARVEEESIELAIG